MTRSTPCRVLRLSSVATSAGVPWCMVAAGAGVEALGALADHHEVDLAGLDVGQRAGGAGPQPGRAQVDVLVEVEAQLQQQAALEHARRHGRVADRAEQDRVVPGQLVEHRVGQHLAGAEVAGGAQVVLGGLAAGQDGVEDLEALRHHLGADAVAGTTAIRATVAYLAVGPVLLNA